MTRKILLASDFFYPHWTGLAKSWYALAKTLAKEHEVTVLTVQTQKDLPLAEKHAGFTIVRAPFDIRISRSLHSFRILKDFVRLAKTTDLVWLNSPSSNIFCFAVLARLMGKKLAIFHQGDLVLPKGLFNRILQSIFNISTFLAFQLAHKVSTYTEDYAQHSRLLPYFYNKFTPFLLPIEIPAGSPSTKIKALFAKLKQEKKIVFGLAGRFVEEKGFDILFRAIPLVLKELPGAVFLFAGEKQMPYENYLSHIKSAYEKVQAHVIFTGLLDKGDLAYFYQNIDLMLIPSRSDCFNLVQAEAALLGTPVVASNIPGARFLVRETGFGEIFTSKDPTDLAKKILVAYKQKESYKKAQSAVKSVLNNDTITQKIKDFIGRGN